jgi:single-strand DNA-binding protein
MAGSLNKVVLLGNLGADPEIRVFANGGRVCNLRIATSDTWKDKNSGERKERTEWHRVTVYAEPTIAFCEKYVKKGHKLYVEGALETRKWQDKDGKDQYTTEITVRPYGGQVLSLTTKDGGTSSHDDDRGEHNQDGDAARGAKNGRDQGSVNGSRQQPPRQHLDDEIPF